MQNQHITYDKKKCIASNQQHLISGELVHKHMKYLVNEIQVVTEFELLDISLLQNYMEYILSYYKQKNWLLYSTL